MVAAVLAADRRRRPPTASVVVTAVTRLRTISAIGVLVGASALGAALFYVVYSSL